jgi:hypothetical protein
MDFLDPKKHKAHLVRLFIGYFLVGTALILTTIILLYQARGFGLKDGEVIQNGLIFVSSRPRPADIYVNNERNEKTTNTRLLLPAGQYTFRLEREGYRTWKRAISIEGGSVARFDYPVLFPKKLTSEATRRYDAKPTIMTQSPDRRWLLVQSGAAYATFDVFDLNAEDEARTPLTVPSGVFGLTEGTHAWEFVEWASNNRNVLLKHVVTNGGISQYEYILVNREDPVESVNLTRTLGVNPTKLELLDKKFDKYVLFNQPEATLTTATLDDPTPEPWLTGVLAYKIHGDDVVLYATAQDAAAGKVAVKLREGDRTYEIREVKAGDAYLLDIAKYKGTWYVVAGAPSENKTYVYRDPAHMQRTKPDKTLVPVQILKAANASYTAFSDNARFIMAQSGQQFSVYDAETSKGYLYTSKAPIDPGQPHASWMDGHRLMYVSSGKGYVADFDQANRESLVAADASYVPVFDRTYDAMFAIAPTVIKAADGTETTQYVLNRTSLLTSKDQ